MQHIHFHLVLCHHHIKLAGSLRTVAIQSFIGTECHTNHLTILLGIVAQRLAVGIIIDTIIIECPHSALRNLRIIRIYRIIGVGIVCRSQTQHHLIALVICYLFKSPGALARLQQVELPVATLSLGRQDGNLRTHLKGQFINGQCDNWRHIAAGEVLRHITVVEDTSHYQLVITVGRSHLEAQY